MRLIITGEKSVMMIPMMIREKNVMMIPMIIGEKKIVINQNFQE